MVLHVNYRVCSGERGPLVRRVSRSEGGRTSRSQGRGTRQRLRNRAYAGLAVAVAGMTAVACGSSSPSSSSGGGTGSNGSNKIPAGLSTSSFSVDIGKTMSAFKPLTAFATKGSNTLQVGVILPDTTSSTRYVNFDQPD